MDSDEEQERQPSDIKIFVDNCDQYVGSAVATFLAKEGYQVYGYGRFPPHPGIKMLGSRAEGIFSTELSVFEMMEDTTAVEEALEIINSHPLHKKVQIAIFSPLMTWGGRVLEKDEPNEEEDEEQANKTEESNEEEEDQETEPETMVNEENFLEREPHPLFTAQYTLESRALQLNEELERLTVYIFAVGLLYGNGERVLYNFFRQLWDSSSNAFPSSKAHISCLHVNNLGIAIRSLFELPEDEERRYFILADQVTPSFREIGRAFSKILADGKVCPVDEDLDPAYKALLTTELAAESNFLQDQELHCQEGIIENAAVVVDEFREKYHLEPIKVLVIGAPASGYEEIAQQVSLAMESPLLLPLELVEEVKTETSEFADEIRQSIEDEEGKISDDVICQGCRRRMQRRDCRNRG